MADPFGDKDQAASKRPAQTIEGTATEVEVEPAPGDAAAAANEGLRGEVGDPSGGTTGDEGQSLPQPPRTRFAAFKNFMTHLAAGLVGGLIGVIALALSSGGFGTGKESAPSPEVTALQQRIAKLEGLPAPAPDTQALDGLDGRIKALEDDEKAETSKLSELSEQIAELDIALKSLGKVAEDGGSVADAAAIGQAIDEAEQKLNAKIDEALAKGDSANASAIEETQKAIAELKAKLGALAEAQLDAGDAGASEPEVAKLTERLAKLEALLPELAGTIDKEAAGAKTAALAIAFANLRASVSDGRPYAAELDTIGALAPSLGDLGVLPAYAEKGIPTVPDLARALAAASDEALATPAPPPDGSLVGSLMASAESLVTIKRIDEAPAGDGASAALARAKAALDKGDLAIAVKEVETLQGKPREAFSSWLGEARARLAAAETLTRLEGALLISLGGDAETTQP